MRTCSVSARSLCCQLGPAAPNNNPNPIQNPHTRPAAKPKRKVLDADLSGFDVSDDKSGKKVYDHAGRQLAPPRSPPLSCSPRTAQSSTAHSADFRLVLHRPQRRLRPHHHRRRRNPATPPASQGHPLPPRPRRSKIPTRPNLLLARPGPPKPAGQRTPGIRTVISAEERTSHRQSNRRHPHSRSLPIRPGKSPNLHRPPSLVRRPRRLRRPHRQIPQTTPNSTTIAPPSTPKSPRPSPSPKPTSPAPPNSPNSDESYAERTQRNLTAEP